MKSSIASWNLEVYIASNAIRFSSYSCILDFVLMLIENFTISLFLYIYIK